jgi:hypothetical protein
MNPALLERIKSKGYWRINFQPKKLLEAKSSLAECRDVIERSALSLRGWEYPFIPRKQNEQQGGSAGGEFYEAWVDWWNHLEYWRSYRSHQFLHYLALREDWFAESDWMKELAKTIAPGQVIGTGGAIWQITEIFEFLSRLGRSGYYPSGALVSLTLENTEGRQLWVDDPQRMPFFDEKKTGAKRIQLTREVLPSDFATEGIEIARSVIIEFFDHFGWDQISLENIRLQQEQMLTGRAD